MIRFACRCSHVLELPDDMAGLTAQCPKCGLLLDVPALSDLGAIEQDGTYRLDNQPKPKVDEHLKELTTVYYPGRQLPDGSEIDLRGPVGPPQPAPAAAPEDASAEPEPAPEPAPVERPKYDPETGELILPIDIIQDQPKPPVRPSELPTAKRVINYTTTATPTGEQVPQTVARLGVFARLFLPVNVVVMGVVLMMHMALVLLAVVANFVVFIIVAPFLLLMVLVGHYAMLVEEMGPSDRDELPRPLRNVHLYDDLFAPFLHMVSALLLCYWPSLVIAVINFSAWLRDEPFPFPQTRLLHWGLFALGSLLFPAVLQTICTSGNIVNLRPDRVLGVIRATGFRYLPIALLWMIGSAACVTGQIAVLLNWALMMGSPPSPPLISRPYVAYPLLMVGVYLLHAFGWILGLEYRRAHSHYPWALQVHVRAPEPVTVPALHPKVAAAEQAAQERAAKRSRPQIR